MEQHKELTFVLPGFPCKSGNTRQKVLGVLPDQGERRALEGLAELCEAISAIYPRGAKLIVVSDGEVFADVIGLPLAAVKLYGEELRKTCSSSCIAFADLEDLMPDTTPSERVSNLLAQFAKPIERLRAEVRADADAALLYMGFARFLQLEFEQFANESRSAFKNRCKKTALLVMQRSDAYSELIRKRFPEAIRLSIHPQGASTEKLGINLIAGTDGIGTPWHNVLVEMRDGSCKLMHRIDAEQGGYLLLHKNGRPSHFVEI